MYKYCGLQTHLTPFSWVLPFLCDVRQLLHHELMVDECALSLQAGILPFLAGG